MLSYGKNIDVPDSQFPMMSRVKNALNFGSCTKVNTHLKRNIFNILDTAVIFWLTKELSHAVKHWSTTVTEVTGCGLAAQKPKGILTTYHEHYSSSIGKRTFAPRIRQTDMRTLIPSINITF